MLPLALLPMQTLCTATKHFHPHLQYKWHQLQNSERFLYKSTGGALLAERAPSWSESPRGARVDFALTAASRLRHAAKVVSARHRLGSLHFTNLEVLWDYRDASCGLSGVRPGSFISPNNHSRRPEAFLNTRQAPYRPMSSSNSIADRR